MDITYYLFVFYVFLLLCGTIWFYGRVMRRSKTKNGGEEKERQLFRLYQNIEDMLGGFEEYAEEAKTGIDERLKQAEALIESMNALQPEIVYVEKTAGNTTQSTAEPDCTNKSGMMSIAQPEAGPMHMDKLEKERAPQSRKPQKSSRRAAGKPKIEDLISKYAAQGMDKAEIARVLGKSQREVSLMMEIKKINLPGNQD